jgi:hypothetical protein
MGAKDGDQQAGVAAAHVDDVTKSAPGVTPPDDGLYYLRGPTSESIRFAPKPS